MASTRFGCRAIGCGAIAADLAVREVGMQLLVRASSRIPVTTATRGLEHDAVAGVQRRHQLGRDHFLTATLPINNGARHGSVMAASAALGSDEVPFPAMCKSHLTMQDLIFAQNPQAAAARAC